ncbi:Protein disulfide-isomerase A5 [Acropora cervicornis]|uniref:Protein disulfide-isomerase A5 n=1 Tax=Acropora cervicornis TaxID=6130 RepID=A0AAD9VDK1_ACRCE|nr:Protein disulfide-isomerase A5 [Acropora cervicornis]
MAEKKTSIIISLLLILFAEPSLQGKKRLDRSSIIEINDVKSFKKIQRTHTNLLVIFAQSDNDASSKFEVLVQAAEEIKGKGTIGYINCGGTKDSKKLCKKLKVSPNPVVLKHYKDGDFNKDFDRKHTLKSVLNFLNDPTGEMPWEEEDGCGFCKKLKPDFALAATELKREAVMAGMDVDTYEGYPVREKYNITGFPTLIYFENGEEKYRYQGKYDRDSIVDWMRNPSPSAPPRKEEDEWKDEPSDVVHLSDGTFDDFVISNPSVLVMFYAPWCGHCKAMKPAYTEAAQTMKEQQIPGVLAAVDATKEQEIGKRYKIEGFPTVKYFKDGEVAFDMIERMADKIVGFMKDPKEPPPPPPPERDWSEIPSEVVHLTTDTFKGFVKKKKHVLVMFYAPWCGHCKKAKPEFMDAAKHDAENSKIAYAAVDCTVQTSVCNQYDVNGYPTFRYFNYGKKDFKYMGGREAKDFMQFMENPREGPPPPPPEPQWSDVPSHVHHLTDDNFDEFMEEHDSVLVMFYAPWCGHCKAMKPDYMDAAEELANRNARGVLTAVDCTKQKSLAKKFEIGGFPTRVLHQEYRKSRTKEDIVDFMLISVAETAEAKPAKPDKPAELPWSEEDSNVFHLTENTFDEFIQTHSSALVMFYAPWCPHCKKVKPEYSKVAKQVNIENKAEGALGAVDCTLEKELCAKQEIRGYPSLCGHCVEMKPAYFKAAEILREELDPTLVLRLPTIFFFFLSLSFYCFHRYTARNGDFEIDYDGDRSVEDIVNFMKSMADEDKGSSVEEKGGEEKKQETEEEPREIDGLKILTEANFETFLSQTEHVLVMFYAPWCSHCQSAKPTFLKASEAFAKEPSKAFTAVDCSQDAEYDGDPTEEDFIAFMASPPQPLPPDQPGNDAEDPRDEL